MKEDDEALNKIGTEEEQPDHELEELLRKIEIFT